MIPNTVRNIPSAFFALWTIPSMLTAQSGDGRPKGYPDANVMVQQFVDDPRGPIRYRIPLVACPTDSDWHGQLFDLIFDLDLDISIRTTIMAGSFRIPLKNCDDPRFFDWYRRYIPLVMESGHEITVGSTIEYVLEAKTEESKELVEDIVTDLGYGDTQRKAAGFEFMKVITPSELEDFFFRHYEAGRLPDDLAEAQGSILAETRTLSFANRMAEIARRSPMTPELHSIFYQVALRISERPGPPAREEVEFYNALGDFLNHTNSRISPSMMTLVQDYRRIMQEKIGRGGGGLTLLRRPER